MKVFIIILGALAALAQGRPNDEICTTQACKDYADLLLGSIDKSVDPCHDFYMYSCGKYINSHDLPDGVNRQGSLDLISAKVNSYLFEVIKEPKKEDELFPIQYLKDYYVSCDDKDTVELKGLEPFDPYVSKDHQLGGWPMIQENWIGDVYKFEYAEAYSKRNLGLDVMMTTTTSLDVKNTTRSLFIILAPKVYLPPEAYAEETDEARKQVEEYKQLMSNVARSFIDFYGADITDLSLRVDEAYEFERNLGLYLRDNQPPVMPEFGPNQHFELESMRVSSLFEEVSIKDLEFLFPNLDIKTLMGEFFEGLDYEFPRSEKNIYADIQYLQWLSEYISETSQKEQANYYYFSFVRDYAYCGPSILTGLKDATDETCAFAAAQAFEWAQARIYVTNKFTDEARSTVNDMVTNLRTAFKSLLDANVWMDKNTIALSKEKVDAMIQNLGYPDWILDDRKFLKFHSDVAPQNSTTFLENTIGVQAWKTKQNLNQMKVPEPRDTFIMPPSLVNAAYMPILNSITFPAAILETPTFDVGHPRYVNYGAAGTVIGHEITHGFDNSGRMYDKYGNLEKWWPDETIEKFNERAQCYVDQYNNFYVPELDNKTHVNGQQTLGENIADNGGIRESFRAYKMQLQDNPADPLLPGLEDYTREQMFFLALGQVWCTLENAAGFANDIKNDVHSPARYRMFGYSMNSDDFAEAFKCPVGTPMNPEHKCVLW